MSERLTPVEKITGPGVYEVTTRLRVDAARVGWIAGDEQTEWWTEHARDIKRVEIDPDLPMWPGAVIRCEIETGTGRPSGPVVAELVAGSWLATGVDCDLTAVQITRVIKVLDHGIDPRPKPGPSAGRAVDR